MKEELAPHTPKVRGATEREREMGHASGESPEVCESERASREEGGKTLRNQSKEERQKSSQEKKKRERKRGVEAYRNCSAKETLTCKAASTLCRTT